MKKTLKVAKLSNGNLTFEPKSRQIFGGGHSSEEMSHSETNRKKIVMQKNQVVTKTEKSVTDLFEWTFCDVKVLLN